MKNSPPEDTDHLPDPHEDQHVADLSPWVAERFIKLLNQYGEAMYAAGIRDARQGLPDYASIHPTHRTASTQLKQLLGVETPDHG